MTGSSSIDISVANVWRSYRAFRAGKKPTRNILVFEEELLDNILMLASDLQKGRYRHGPYTHMIVSDTKRRDIAVAAVRDRIVHRLLYDYLVPIWDKTFIYDAWSCRPDKGLHRAIDRAQLFMRQYPDGWLWRADITKLFDSIDTRILKQLLCRRIYDPIALHIIDTVLDGYTSFAEHRGIPIGNLTSQIFANIYLNEFDRYIKHNLKPDAYLRYGDDWLCFIHSKSDLETLRKQAIDFLARDLSLTIHTDLNMIKPVKRGVSYLGVDIWPTGIRLNGGAQIKLKEGLNLRNINSYKSLVGSHQSRKHVRRLDWAALDIIVDTL